MQSILTICALSLLFVLSACNDDEGNVILDPNYYGTATQQFSNNMSRAWHNLNNPARKAAFNAEIEKCRTINKASTIHTRNPDFSLARPAAEVDAFYTCQINFRPSEDTRPDGIFSRPTDYYISDKSGLSYQWSLWRQVYSGQVSSQHAQYSWENWRLQRASEEEQLRVAKEQREEAEYQSYVARYKAARTQQERDQIRAENRMFYRRMK